MIFSKLLLCWRRQWHPTPVLLLGKSHGRRSLVGCSLWGHTESDTTEASWRLGDLAAVAVVVLIAQSCLTLAAPWAIAHHTPLHGILQARILKWVAIPFSRGSLAQELNPGILHCRQILYCLSHQGSPFSKLIQLYNRYHWRRQRQPTPVLLPGKSHGRGAWWAAVHGVAQSQT